MKKKNARTSIIPNLRAGHPVYILLLFFFEGLLFFFFVMERDDRQSEFVTEKFECVCITGTLNIKIKF